MTVFAKKGDHFKRWKKHKPLFHTSVSIQRMLFFYLIFLNLFFCADYPFLNQMHLCNCGYSKKKAHLNKLYKVIGHPIQFCKSSDFKMLACWTGYHTLRLIKFIVSPWCTDTESQTKWSVVISAMCGWLIYSNENSRCSSSTMVASIISSLYEQFSPSVRGAPPSTSVTSEWRYGLAHPQLQSDSQIFLFVCFICR